MFLFFLQEVLPPTANRLPLQFFSSKNKFRALWLLWKTLVFLLLNKNTIFKKHYITSPTKNYHNINKFTTCEENFKNVFINIFKEKKINDDKQVNSAIL